MKKNDKTRNRRHERQSADTCEKRTLIDTDASQHRLTLMIFICVNQP